MADTGSPYNLPYPLAGDQVSVHTDIQALAESVASNLDNFPSLVSSNDFLSLNTFTASNSNPVVTVTQNGSGAAISTNGKIVAGEFEKSGGLSTEFLKADGSVDSTTYLTSNQSITVSGDATGSGTTSIELTLANSGVTSGTYNNSATQVRPFTVDAKGRITSIETAVTITPAWSSISSTPTTLSGYGITDAQPLDADLTAIAALSGTSGFLKTNGSGTWSVDTVSYQPLDGDLTAIAELSGTTGFLVKTGTNSWSIDETVYLSSLPTHASNHESGGVDEIRGSLTYATLTGSTSITLLNTAYGLNRMNFINHTTETTLTLPSNTTSAFPIGTQIHFMVISSDADTVSFAAGSGATLTSQGNKLKMNGQWSVATAVKTGTNSWVVFGNLIA
jgi:hypothetical protein